MRRSGLAPARTGGRPGDATYGSWQLRRLSPMVTAGHLITAQVVVGAVSLVINAMSARTMGPRGRGDLALLLQITYVANLIAVAGVDRSYAATVPPEHDVRSAIRDTVRLVAPTAAVVIVGAAAVAWWIDGSGRHQRMLAATGLVLTAVSLVAASTLRTAATATGVTRPYVLSALVGQVTLLASAALLTAAGVGSSDLWLLGYGAALSVGPLAAWLLLRRSGGPPARATRDLSAARRLGLRLVPAALASMVLLRGDRLLLPWLGSYDDLGIYIVVATLSEFAIWPIQNHLDAQAPRWHQRFLAGEMRCRGPLLIAFGYGIAAGLVLLAAGHLMVVPVFGAEYRASTVLLVPLSIGTAFLSVSRAAIGLGVAAGRARVALAADIPAMVVCLGACVLLIPRYGALGAAVASALAYGVGAAVAVLLCLTVARRVAVAAPDSPAVPVQSLPRR